MNITRFMNPQALTAMYGDIPSFVGAEALSVVFSQDGPSVFVKFMMKGKPLKKPARWPSVFDVVYVEISFGAAEIVGFSKWGRSNVVSEILACLMDGRELVKFIFENECCLEFSYDWACVEGINYGLIGSP
ncbi:Imm50 family immunity protein [Pseudomonas sp. LAM2023]|uniref:Imm50 family immunity protein n=1 Tax=Pseudomonas sp. LAM2023 TaxID=2800477 RepID=UPI0019091B50|nr:Imm50 family immunity protein [Pseudomonas sp. LAM2023]